jgi:hypothetical protein
MPGRGYAAAAGALSARPAASIRAVLEFERRLQLVDGSVRVEVVHYPACPPMPVDILDRVPDIRFVPA